MMLVLAASTCILEMFTGMFTGTHLLPPWPEISDTCFINMLGGFTDSYICTVMPSIFHPTCPGLSCAMQILFWCGLACSTRMRRLGIAVCGTSEWAGAACMQHQPAFSCTACTGGLCCTVADAHGLSTCSVCSKSQAAVGRCCTNSYPRRCSRPSMTHSVFF